MPIRKLLCRAFCIVVLAVVSFHGLACSATEAPSNTLVIAAIREAWTREDKDKLTHLKKNRQIILDRCALLASACRFYGPGGISSKCSAAAWRGMDAYLPSCPVYATKEECVQGNISFCHANNVSYFGPELFPGYDDPSASESEIESKIKSFKFRADDYVFVGIRTNNFEGNIISYVDIRQKGHEDVERYRVVLQIQNDKLFVVSMDTSNNP